MKQLKESAGADGEIDAGELVHAVMALANKIVAKMDTNKDGGIDQAEAMKGMIKMGMTTKEA